MSAVASAAVAAANAANGGINSSVAQMCSSLSSLMSSGIQVDQHLRQPTYYTWVTFGELKVECMSIVADLLSGQRVPLWLSQRIAWYYANKYFQEIVADLSIGNNDSGLETTATAVETTDSVAADTKMFKRERIVTHLRNAVPSIVKEWLAEKSKLFEQNVDSLLFSFARVENGSAASKPLIYHEFGIKNKRRVMEDKTSVFENVALFHRPFLFDTMSAHASLLTTSSSSSSSPVARADTALFGIFDGHCGVSCAQYVSSQLPMNIIQHSNMNAAVDAESDEQRRNLVEQAIRESFRAVSERFNAKARKEAIKGGSTACVCLLTQGSAQSTCGSRGSLTAAWCGDTQLCLVRDGRVAFVSGVHKPENEAEKSRVELAGGKVVLVSSVWRVNGTLSVSRSFGDIEYQSSGVSSEPDVHTLELDGNEDYVVIGCDGLWESVTPGEVVQFVYELATQTPAGSVSANVAESLAMRAKEQGSSDNITVIFVLLRDSLCQIGKPPPPPPPPASPTQQAPE